MWSFPAAAGSPAANRRCVASAPCCCAALLIFGALAHPARAQVVIPHGDFGGGVETWLVAGVSFLLLCVAVWQYWRGR